MAIKRVVNSFIVCGLLRQVSQTKCCFFSSFLGRKKFPYKEVGSGQAYNQQGNFDLLDFL